MELNEIFRTLQPSPDICNQSQIRPLNDAWSGGRRLFFPTKSGAPATCGARISIQRVPRIITARIMSATEAKRANKLLSVDGFM